MQTGLVCPRVWWLGYLLVAEDEPLSMASPEALNFSLSSTKNSLVINTQPKKLQKKKKKKCKAV